MKRSLGSLLLLLFYSTLAWSEDFSHSFTVDNHQPYVKEAVLLTLKIKQTNHDKVLFFNFDLEKSPNYRFQRVAIQEQGKHHFAYREYSYLIYPLKSGKINLNFKLQKRATTDEGISYSYSGDRDNVKGLETVDSDITLAPITLEVKALPKETELVGDFKLQHQFKTHQAKAYQAIPFELEIKGHGYPPLLENILLSENNITLFKEQPLIKSVSSIKGTENTISYSMALSSNKSFSLKERIIKAFNPKTQKSYVLSLPQQDFTIEPVEPSSLVDKEDFPKPLKSDFSWLGNFFSYFIVFIAGYLTAFAYQWREKSKPKTEHPLYRKIKKSKNAKELLQLLMANNQDAFKPTIEALENLIYKKSKTSFKSIKEALETEIKEME
jgi:hypothetical protein